MNYLLLLRPAEPVVAAAFFPSEDFEGGGILLGFSCAIEPPPRAGGALRLVLEVVLGGEGDDVPAEGAARGGALGRSIRSMGTKSSSSSSNMRRFRIFLNIFKFASVSFRIAISLSTCSNTGLYDEGPLSSISDWSSRKACMSS